MLFQGFCNLPIFEREAIKVIQNLIDSPLNDSVYFVLYQFLVSLSITSTVIIVAARFSAYFGMHTASAVFALSSVAVSIIMYIGVIVKHSPRHGSASGWRGPSCS